MINSSKKLKIEQIEQIAVRVHDIHKAIEFYRDKLELNLTFSTDNMAFFDLKDITVVVCVPELDEFDHRSSVIYFKVDNIEESHQILITRDVKFRGKPHIVHKTCNTEHWMLFFEDVDDNIHALTSQVSIN